MASRTDYLKSVVNDLSDGVYFLDRSRQIVYWSKGAERITGYKAEEVQGSHCSDNILCHVDVSGENLCELSVCPASRAMNQDRIQESEVYLHHKNGHRIPVFVRCHPWLDDNNHIQGAIETFRSLAPQSELLSELERLRQLALIDALTGIANRRFGEARLDAYLSEMARTRIPIGIALLDVDHFKKINDNLSHKEGDMVLRMVANTLSGNIRPLDMAVRWGGEEFVVIFPNIEDSTLQSVAERLRIMIMESFLLHNGNRISVTASIGATVSTPEDMVESLINRADQLMYRSKAEGRNRVTMG